MIVLAIVGTIGAVAWTLMVLWANGMRSSPGAFEGGALVWAAWFIVAVLWLGWVFS